MGSLGENPLLCPPVDQSSDSLARMILANINSFQELDSAYYCWEEGQLSVYKEGFLLCGGLRAPSLASVALGNPSAVSASDF